ncbi:MAG: histidine--tRNA ligase [Alphaproteobacteria bacterium]|nr:MAG: histidine--tRNA ligase [Alphaproteobacteria bacterium]
MADKKQKTFRPKARLPRGFADRDAADIRATEEMLGKIREVFERYGFDPVETPMFEYTDALGKFLPDADRPGEGVFSLQDDDEQWLSLRYDLTAPLARHVAENINTIQLPYRTYRAGWVFRNEKPGPGRFRQFMQFDADTVGAPGVQADAEMAMMMADTMEALGIARGGYVVRVNNRKVLDGVMEAIGVTDEGQKLAVLRAIDKLDKFGIDGVRQLLGEGRKDESGDFTKGAGLSEGQIKPILQLLEMAKMGAVATLHMFDKIFPESAKFREAFEELGSVASLVRSAGYSERQIGLDVSVVRGLEYYTGPVFECELTFPVVNEKGETVVFGSVAGGGRYDGLVKRFTGQDVPATGFSIGVSRLMTALKNLGKLDTAGVVAPVLVTVMDRDTEALGRYQKFTQRLREAGIRAEMYQGNPKNFGNQLKYADRRGSPIAVIQGSDERARGRVQLKDLIEGKRQAEAIASNQEWREKRPGQFEIDEADLVAEVQKLLAAQKTDRGA